MGVTDSVSSGRDMMLVVFCEFYASCAGLCVSLLAQTLNEIVEMKLSIECRRDVDGARSMVVGNNFKRAFSCLDSAAANFRAGVALPYRLYTPINTATSTPKPISLMNGPLHHTPRLKQACGSSP